MTKKKNSPCLSSFEIVVIIINRSIYRESHSNLSQRIYSRSNRINHTRIYTKSWGTSHFHEKEPVQVEQTVPVGMIDRIGNNDRRRVRAKRKGPVVVWRVRGKKVRASKRASSPRSSPERRGITQSSAGRYFIFADRLQRPVHSRGIVAGISMHNKRAVSPAPWLTPLAPSFLRVKGGCAPLQRAGSLFSSRSTVRILLLPLSDSRPFRKLPLVCRLSSFKTRRA